MTDAEHTDCDTETKGTEGEFYGIKRRNKAFLVLNREAEILCVQVSTCSGSGWTAVVPDSLPVSS